MQAKPGFVWTIDSYSRDGKLIDTEVKKNLMPDQGLNHWLSVLVKAEPQITTWFIGLFGEDYLPQPSDEMSMLPVAAGEVTDYLGSTRKTFNPGDVIGGECNSYASPAEFEFTSLKTVRGAFLTSSSGKGAVSGKLLSVVKFATPKVKETGEILRVRATLGLVSF